MPLTHHPIHTTGTVQDSIIASCLIAAPAWGAILNELNGILTTLSLLIGLMIGIHRLWVLLTKPNDGADKS